MILSLPARQEYRAARSSLALICLVFTLGLVLGASAQADEDFSKCAQAFAADDAGKAPQRTKWPSSEGAADMVALCYRAGQNVFFAVDYSTKWLMPGWVAYRLGNKFGADG